MNLKAGSRLESTVCDVQVIVVRAPTVDVDLRCGGGPLVPFGQAETRSEPDASLMGGTAVGKRFADEESGLEILCTRAGDGTLTVNGTPIAAKDAKALPASD